MSGESGALCLLQLQLLRKTSPTRDRSLCARGVFSFSPGIGNPHPCSSLTSRESTGPAENGFPRSKGPVERKARTSRERSQTGRSRAPETEYFSFATAQHLPGSRHASNQETGPDACWTRSPFHQKVGSGVGESMGALIEVARGPPEHKILSGATCALAYGLIFPKRTHQNRWYGQLTYINDIWNSWCGGYEWPRSGF
jgi:hypothetical protein